MTARAAARSAPKAYEHHPAATEARAKTAAGNAGMDMALEAAMPALRAAAR